MSKQFRGAGRIVTGMYGLAITGVCSALLATPTGVKGQDKPVKAAQANKSADGKPAWPAESPLHIWQDRGSLTPIQVFWGDASRFGSPESHRPAPPFSDFERDDDGTSAKCKVKDKNGVKWTVKFGEEVHADIAAPRLAWALGYWTDENYYVKAGKIEGITSQTDLGKCKKYIAPDGTFAEARFKGRGVGKRVKGPHDKSDKTDDADWDERKNPGVPPEQLSGLLILEVMVHNWDSQPKNNRVDVEMTHSGPQTWFLVSDWGASFGQMKSKGVLADYQKEKSFITKVDADAVYFKFDDIIKAMEPVHEKIPLAHARWFGKQLDKLTDAHLRAAFQAAYASDDVYQSYTKGEPADKSAFSPLTAEEIEGYVKAFRARMDEFKAKVK